MGLDAIVGGGTVSLIVLLSLIQIAPIKLNPWSAIGKAFNKDLLDKMDDIQTDVKKLEQNDMDQARGRILRFADEIRRHVDHSKEFFDHIQDDITDYEYYCETHPDYKNEKAVQSIALIREVFHECEVENKFL